jgi:hypothetical protein
MWSSLALAATLTLAPGQSGQLKLTNERITYGVLGAPRPDAKFLPGDQCFLRFDIEGLQVDKRGKVIYSMGMEFTTTEGKTKFKKAEDPKDLEAINSLGGSRLPAFAYTEIGSDNEPGEYTLKVTVTDRATKQSQTLTQKLTVLPKAFGLVRPQLAYLSREWIPAPNSSVAGQTLMATIGVAGFERDKTKKQPKLVFELRILDESGKPVLAEPDTIRVEDQVEPNRSVVEVPFVINLNRSGKFSIEYKVTDEVAKKTATKTIPISVVDQK